MKYKREFIIQASHFNGGQTYENYQNAMATKSFALLHDVLIDQHGHNFKIIVEAEGNLDDKTLFVIDDLELEKVINHWNNTNLTLHPDFQQQLEEGKRISLELMVDVLYHKILDIFKIHNLKLTIYETETISASIGFQ